MPLSEGSVELTHRFDEPLRVGLHVDHRYRAAELELRDEFEQKSRRWLSTGKRLIGARLLVEAEIPMGRDAAEIERPCRRRR